MASARASRGSRLLLFLLLWPTYAYFYQSGSHNEAARLDQARAMIADGTLWVDQYAYNSADLISFERDGERHSYSGKAPGTTLIAAIPLKIWNTLLRPLHLSESVHWHLVVYLTTISTVSLLSALASIAIFDAALLVGLSIPSALLGVVAIGLGSIAFPFSTLMFGHQIAAAFLAFAFWWIVRRRRIVRTSIRRPRFELLLAGLAAGLAVVTEYPTVILAVLLTGYLLWTLWTESGELRDRVAGGAAFASGALAAALVLVAYNFVIFGRVFYVPYQAYLEGTEAALFPAHEQGILGVHWPGWTGFVEVLREITVRPQRGILYLGADADGLYALSPVLWLVVPGLLFLAIHRRTRVEALLVTIAALAFLTFNACYGTSIIYWGGGASVGPRHLVPLLPLLALPLATTVRRLWWAFFPLLTLSIFYTLLATATEPRPGYGFQHPSRDLFLASYLSGRLSLSRDPLFDTTGRLLTEDSVAFNLGKLAGLPGAWQLAPLMLWWLAIGVLLARKSLSDPVARSRAPDSLDHWILRPPKGLRFLVPIWIAAFGLVVVGLPSLAGLEDRTAPGNIGLTGRYFPNGSWSGDPVEIQVDRRIDFDWFHPPWPVQPPFSIEWTGSLEIDRPGLYTFWLESDDGSILEIDGKLVVDNSGHHAMREATGQARLEAGSHAVRLRYFNELFGGAVRLWWASDDIARQVVPSRVLRPGG